MKTYEIKIKGVSDMLVSRLSREVNQEMKKVPRDKKEDWEDENWEKKLYKQTIDGTEYLIIPDLNMWTFVQEACKKYKVPVPKDVGRTWTAHMKSCCIIPEHSIINYKDVQPFGTMVNGNPSSGKKSSKVYRVRPRISGWSMTIKLLYTDEYLNKQTLKEIFEIGGKYVGIGDWRPLYGRFTVESIKEVN